MVWKDGDMISFTTKRSDETPPLVQVARSLAESACSNTKHTTANTAALCGVSGTRARRMRVYVYCSPGRGR